MYDDTPPLEPRSGDYAAMLDRATRRRRVRRLRGLAAGAPVVALAVALTALPDGNGAASLRPTAEATESTQPTPEPAEPQPSETGSPQPTPEPADPPKESPTGEPTEDPAEPTGEPEPSPRLTPRSPHPTGSPVPSPRPPDQPATYVYLDGAAPEDCATSGGATAAPDTANWCAVYAGDDTLARHDTVLLPFRLCRSAAAPTGTLTRYSSDWLKARVVAEDGDVPWSWHAGGGPAAPAIAVEPGDCAQWTIRWRVDVTPGAYDLHPVFIVEEYQVPADANRVPVTITA